MDEREIFERHAAHLAGPERAPVAQLVGRFEPQKLIHCKGQNRLQPARVLREALCFL